MQNEDSIQDQQLFHLIKNIANRTENGVETNLIVGYSLFKALSRYEPESQNISPEQAKFDEIKQVYRELKQNLQYCIKHGGQKTFLNLIPTEGVMREYATEQMKPRSKLLEQIVRTNSFQRAEKNFGDYVETKADKLQEIVLDRGEFKGNKNTLTNDYEAVLKSFL